MSCRTGSNAGVTGSVAAITKAPTETVQMAFHALRREGARENTPTPEPAEVAAWLHRQRELLKQTPDIPDSRRLLHKIKLAQAREDAENGIVPDGPTWHAWTRLAVDVETRQAITRRKAVIFDIDGTLSDNAPMRGVPGPPPDQHPPNWDGWMAHTTNLEAREWVRDATHQVGDDEVAVVLTARSNKYRDMTTGWLARSGARVDDLHMRPDDDTRPDWEYKEEAIDRLEREYDIQWAAEDNPRVVEMLESRGYPTVRVPGYEHAHSPQPTVSSAYPVYEVGDPQTAAPGVDARNYTKRDKVSPWTFGLRHDPDPEYPAVIGPGQVTRVPLAEVITDQGYVYEPHVRNLATVPAATLEASPEGLPEVLCTREGYLLTHGNHRAAAALLRGDTDLLVTAYPTQPAATPVNESGATDSPQPPGRAGVAKHARPRLTVLDGGKAEEPCYCDQSDVYDGYAACPAHS